MSDVSNSGWQQKPVPLKRTTTQCPHLGALFASLTLSLHPEGHEWACGCGQRFVVVSNAGREKRLVPRFSPRPAPRSRPRPAG